MKAFQIIWPWLGVLLGAALSIWGIGAAIFRSSPWWYSPFVLGSYALFCSLNYLIAQKSSALALRDAPTLWLKLYIWLAAISFVVDLPFGRKMGEFWYYPTFTISDVIVHVWLIGYPFALLSAAEMYWLFSRLFRSPSRQALVSDRYRRIAALFLILSVALLATSIILRLTTGLGTTRKVLILALIVSIFGLDSLAALLRKPSFIRAVAAGNWKPVVGLLVISPLIALVHEYPNTFAHEWVYQNIPYIRAEILGINAFVLTLGWLFLVVISITVAHILAPEKVPHSLGGDE